MPYYVLVKLAGNIPLMGQLGVVMLQQLADSMLTPIIHPIVACRRMHTRFCTLLLHMAAAACFAGRGAVGSYHAEPALV